MKAMFILLNTITVLFGPVNKKMAVNARIDTPYLFEAPVGTDVTVTLQQALNQHKIVYINKSYLISNSLTIPSGGTLSSGKLGNGILKASNTREGLLNSNGTYINISYANAVSVLAVKFEPADNMVNLSGYRNTVVLLSNSANCTISGNNFDFAFNYAKGMEAVWITGPYSRSNIVSNNYINTLGITYCENGASYNIVRRNHIINSHQNALGGIGNGTAACMYNQVLDNTIENAGRMGIEDQRNVIGTVISGNTILGTGKLIGLAAGEGTGISAVAKNTIVENNKITDSKDYYIEVGGSNKLLVANNSIFDTGVCSGIFVNFLGSTIPTAANTTIISKNTIVGCKKGIETFGKASKQYIAIDSNIITNPVTHGINLNFGSSKGSVVTLAGNNITFSNKTSSTRFGIATYSTITSGKQNYIFNVSNNIFTYMGLATKGSGHDDTMLIAVDNAVISNNTIIGYPGGFNIGVTNNGAVTTGVKFITNTVKLASWNIKQFSN